MNLLIDTNVALDYLLKRKPYCNEASSILALYRTNQINGYIVFHSISIIWYALRKRPEVDRRQALMEITNLLTVIAAPHLEVVNAIKNEAFTDFEDCLQEKFAVAVEADYIMTNNIKDFAVSTIPAVNSAKMLEILIRGALS